MWSNHTWGDCDHTVSPDTELPRSPEDIYPKMVFTRPVLLPRHVMYVAIMSWDQELGTGIIDDDTIKNKFRPSWQE